MWTPGRRRPRSVLGQPPPSPISRRRQTVGPVGAVAADALAGEVPLVGRGLRVLVVEGFDATRVVLRAVVARGFEAVAARGLDAAVAARGFAVATLGFDAADARGFAAGFLALAPGPRRFLRPVTRADSSTTSALTSARRTVRLSRFFGVALSSRPLRRASSSRAAASANSSHSRWRATAAVGLIGFGLSVAIRSPLGSIGRRDHSRARQPVDRKPFGQTSLLTKP